MKGHRQKLWKLVPQICELFETSTLTIQQIANYVDGTYRHTWNTISKNFSRSKRISRKKKNYSTSRKGKNNPSFGKLREDSFAWKSGRREDGKGYMTVLKPLWYTARKGYNYIYEHHYVFCINNNLTEIPKGYVVHHKDFIKMNNEIDNLQLMTMSAHSKFHALLRSKLKKGAETIPKGSRH